MLQFFSASTNIVNSKRAITECLENALVDQPNQDCDLIIIYSAMGHNFKELLREAHRLSPNAQVVGCTCAGVIGKEGPDESLKALAIMAIKGPKNEFAVAGTDNSEKLDPFSFGKQLADELKNKNPDINLILFHPSLKGMLYELHIIISGIESVFGSEVPIIGGVSFDGRLISDFQFVGERIFEQGAVIVGLADSSIELVSWANHGLEIVGSPLTVTKSEQNRILELDGRKTWEILMEKLGLPLTSSTPDVLAISSLASELKGEYHKEFGARYKVVAGLIPDSDGCISTLYPSPAGTKLWLTRRNEQKIFNGVDWMMSRIIEHLDGRKPVAVYHADCQARGKLLFNRIMKDEIINRLQFPICRGESTPWLGMYGGGEITPMAGKNQVHAFTSSLYVLVRRM